MTFHGFQALALAAALVCIAAEPAAAQRYTAKQGGALAAFFAPPQASAQANAAPELLKFEVASIKVATSGFNGVRGGCRGIDSVYGADEQARGGIPPLGRCVITDARLSHLIGIAYGVSMQALDTAEDWIQRGDLRFDVQAKAENPASATRQQLLTMLQNLLVERFQLRFHYVTKEEPGFALVVAKNGPKLRTSTSEEEKLTFIGPNGEEVPKPVSKAIRKAVPRLGPSSSFHQSVKS